MSISGIGMTWSNLTRESGRVVFLSTRNLTLILLLVLLVRFALLGATIDQRVSFDPDEAWFLSVASSFADEGRFGTTLWSDWAESSDSTYWYMPGQILVVSGVFQAFDVSYVIPRIVALIVSAATIAITYFLGRQLFNEKIGLLGAIVLAADPLFIFSSGYFRPEVWVAFFGSGALYVLLRRKTRLHSVIAGLAISLAAFFHPNGIFFLASFIALLWFCGRRRDIAPFMLGFMPLAIGYALYAGVGGGTFLEQAEWNYIQSGSTFHNIAEEWNRYSTFVLEHKGHIGISVLWLLGVAYAIKTRPAAAIPLLIICAISLISFSLVRNKWYVYFSTIAPFLSILTGLFLYKLIELMDEVTKARVKKFATVAVTVLVPAALAFFLVVTASVQRFDWNRISSSLENSVPSQGTVVGSPVYEYVLQDHAYIDCIRAMEDIVPDMQGATSDLFEFLQIDIVILDRYCRPAWITGSSDVAIETELDTFTLQAEIEDDHYGNDGLIQIWERSR